MMEQMKAKPVGQVSIIETDQGQSYEAKAVIIAAEQGQEGWELR
ncbi:MAG: hypothetical protein ACLUUO_05210 [Sellimonas intestinalis]